MTGARRFSTVFGASTQMLTEEPVKSGTALTNASGLSSAIK